MKIRVFYLSCLLAVAFAGCTTRGVNKNLNTGLTTRYVGMSTETAEMVMDGGELNNSEVPLGASFAIVNDHVRGLVAKNDKYSIGCSLTITDKQGAKLLDLPDLFKGNDIFDLDKAGRLKCTVNTGNPMQKGEFYVVTVVFSDKYGTGKIENQVTIKAI